MSHTKRGRRSGTGTRLFRFGGAAQPELPGQVGEQKGKLGAAVCGPFRVATVRLGAGGPGEAGPGLARALPAGGCRSPGAILPPDPREAAVRPSGAEWKRRNEGKKEDVLKSQLCVFRCLSLSHFLSARYHGFAVAGAVGRAPLCSDLLWESVTLADA